MFVKGDCSYVRTNNKDKPFKAISSNYIYIQLSISSNSPLYTILFLIKLELEITKFRMLRDSKIRCG